MPVQTAKNVNALNLMTQVRQNKYLYTVFSKESLPNIFYDLLHLKTIFLALITWNAWSSWATCSVSCNGGTQQRDRSCNANGGPACWKVEGEYKLCNIESCRKQTPC